MSALQMRMRASERRSRPTMFSTMRRAMRNAALSGVCPGANAGSAVSEGKRGSESVAVSDISSSGTWPKDLINESRALLRRGEQAAIYPTCDAMSVAGDEFVEGVADWPRDAPAEGGEEGPDAAEIAGDG